eukprot:gene19038-25633_t
MPRETYWKMWSSWRGLQMIMGLSSAYFECCRLKRSTGGRVYRGKANYMAEYELLSTLEGMFSTYMAGGLYIITPDFVDWIVKKRALAEASIVTSYESWQMGWWIALATTDMDIGLQVDPKNEAH